MSTVVKTGDWVAGDSLYCLCDVSVNLKRFTSKKVYFKTNKKELSQSRVSEFNYKAVFPKTGREKDSHLEIYYSKCSQAAKLN